MADERTPIIVGVGQFCPESFNPDQALSPVELAAVAAKAALADCRSKLAVDSCVDALAFVRLFSDSAHRLRSPFGGSTKPPVSVAQRLRLKPRVSIYSQVGGNSPQQLINEAANSIAQGEFQAVMICGAEALRTTAEARRSGLELNWEEDPPGECEDRGPGPPLASALERRHGLGPPVNTYPLFEHAIRGSRGASVAAHLQSMATLYRRLNEVALRNPNARFATPRSADDLATVNEENRWIGHPYPKWLNAQDRVDQAAAVLLTSAGAARRLGIDPGRWIHLLGGADIDEKPLMLDRIGYARSPAIEAVTEAALEMAELSVDQISMFDLYSCFPSAVELACEALRIREDDERDLTVTGGLAFFGGPGNNYSLHAVADMCTRLRGRPELAGLVLANGGYLSKESCGIYSARPAAAVWRGGTPKGYQRRIDSMRGPAVVAAPSGAAIIETYTVTHARGIAEQGIVIGRLSESDARRSDARRSDARFIATTPPGRPEILRWMIESDPLGAAGQVGSAGGINTFIPQGFD